MPSGLTPQSILATHALSAHDIYIYIHGKMTFSECYNLVFGFLFQVESSDLIENRWLENRASIFWFFPNVQLLN